MLKKEAGIVWYQPFLFYGNALKLCLFLYGKSQQAKTGVQNSVFRCYAYLANLSGNLKLKP